jgi:signal transduction histidine kinase
LLLFVALVTVVVVSRNLLLGDARVEAAAALEQETAEFLRVARSGIDQATDEPYADGRELLVNHIRRQFVDDDEILLGVTADGEILPQRGQEAVEIATRENRLDAILADPRESAILETRDGDLLWSKVPVLDVEGNPDGTFIVAYAVDVERAEVDNTVGLLGIVSLIGLLIAAAASWVVSGQILAPVNVVRRTAAEITGEDITRRIPVEGNDDIAALSDQFNAMLDRLDTAFLTQRRFVDDAGHELRTPITIIRGNIELMGEDPVERAEVTRLCVDELDRMSRIVEDLLLLAKAENPDFVRTEIVDLVDLTSDIDAKIRALGDRDWRLEAIAEGDVAVDPHRITQAVVQLAHNAVAHTERGGRIGFGSSADASGTTFWITDDGPGVRPEDGAAVFERFSRGSTGGARKNATGAGLGLSIVRAIAEGHHGSVELDSVFGRGATFRLRFPTAVPNPTIEGEPA